MDYGMVGMGAGVMPGLLQKLLGINLFGSSSPEAQKANSTNIAAPMGLPASGQPTAAQQAEAQKNWPGVPAAQLPDYIRANPESFPQTSPMSNGFDLSKIGASLGKMSSAAPGGGGAPSNMPQTMGSPIVPPSYSGSGPTPGASSSMTPQMLAMAMQLPGGMQGAPLGPAAQNPLLSMLRGRLGIV